jgi:hypothetical protein
MAMRQQRIERNQQVQVEFVKAHVTDPPGIVVFDESREFDRRCQ